MGRTPPVPRAAGLRNRRGSTPEARVVIRAASRPSASTIYHNTKGSVRTSIKGGCPEIVRVPLFTTVEKSSPVVCGAWGVFLGAA